MRALTSAMLFTLLGTASSAEIRDDEMMREALKDCQKNQLSINFCARHKFDVVDEKLNKLYQALLGKMITPPAKERLRQSQRSWVTFRDKDCLVLVGPPERGGSMYQGLWWQCAARRTQERVVELERLDKLLQCEEQPCPPTE